ncbi:hypothetical protein ER308_18190 [Egibacter rhizosphaerae]|uniref:FAD-binding domain-containing protein n=1 Tax=Egibacter rhizosphaerae TaxID=1670831 RepID=A0A411YJJ6_9ACTN|nr:FAD-dependent monooxygenase [Egibacter rhizosphaerae]QBI21309.1 hypothetical protein ER308_18190 [Egibacter rhizosphaerae]
MSAASDTPRTPVAIVGAGPVGLALALGLARHGIASTVVERNDTTSPHAKAPGIHVRTREVLARWGAAEPLVEAGVLLRHLTLHAAGSDRALLTADFGRLDDEADRPGLLVLEQSEVERGLLELVQQSGASEVRFGTEAVGLDHQADGVRLTLRDASGTSTLDAEYVVGCDGIGSFVREAVGLPFDGFTYSLGAMLADVALDDARDDSAWPRVRNSAGGLTAALRLRPGRWRLIRLHPGAVPLGDSDEARHVRDDEVAACVAETLGTGQVRVDWANRFQIQRRSARRFRVGRVLLAGDAAHVHSPAGGQGMNAGIQDAGNLAWKLAGALRGGDAHRLLDSYDVERRAVVVGSVSRYTDFVTRAMLQTPAPARAAGFAAAGAMLGVSGSARRALRRTAMLDLHYPASPLLDGAERAAGRRLPNPWLRSTDGELVRLHDRLPLGAALIAVGDTGSAHLALLAEHAPVDAVVAVGPSGYEESTGVLTRLLGASRGWILVRPDGHVAWARREPDGLVEAAAAALGWSDSGAAVGTGPGAGAGPQDAVARR